MFELMFRIGLSIAIFMESASSRIAGALAVERVIKRLIAKIE
jgi:hypothetical protein